MGPVLPWIARSPFLRDVSRLYGGSQGEIPVIPIRRRARGRCKFSVGYPKNAIIAELNGVDRPIPSWNLARQLAIGTEIREHDWKQDGAAGVLRSDARTRRLSELPDALLGGTRACAGALAACPDRHGAVLPAAASGYLPFGPRAAGVGGGPRGGGSQRAGSIADRRCRIVEDLGGRCQLPDVPYPDEIRRQFAGRHARLPGRTVRHAQLERRRQAAPSL